MKPFEGIRVLDLTHVLAGPFCTHQLAVLGADVVKVEPPDRPDMTRVEGVDADGNAADYGTYFQANGSGKRAITLDLRTDGGREVMDRLVAGTDVLVQNYAGDAIDELGYGWERARSLNGRLVHCSLSGFGHTGPKADHPAYDVVIQAFSGLMAANGEEGWTPTRVGPPMVDYGTGAQAALAISAALFQRDRTGAGQRIDVSMLDCALMLMGAMVVDTLTDGHAPPPHGNEHRSYAGYATFETADGTLMVGAWTNEQLGRLLDVLGESDRAAEVRSMPRSEAGSSRDADRALLAGHLATRSAAEWEAALNDARVPAARVRRLDETLDEEQLASRRGLQAVALPDGMVGPSAFPLAGYGFEHGGPSIDRPPPRLGEHTDEVLAELGYDEAAVAHLRATGCL